MIDTLTRIRRDLHRIPELDFDLPQTIDYVRTELESLGSDAEIFSPCKSTVCAFFDFGSDATTAIRSDMDALPVREETGVPFRSTHEGCMHACGHDGHMAMALGLAHRIAHDPEGIARNVLLVFQPAEETTGGANVVCKSGVFERYRVDRIFGFHLWPDLPKGAIASRSGALLAACNEITVTMNGVSSHIAKAAEGRDALVAGAMFVHEMNVRMDKERSEPCLLKFGHMTSGTVRNAIAATSVVEGSLRTFSLEKRQTLQAAIKDIARKVADAEGCTCTVDVSEGYPPVINDAALFARAKEFIPELETIPEPLLIAEDFSHYQQHLPGVFLLLGTGTGIPLHASTFDFDERVLEAGLSVYERLVRIP